MLDKVRDRMANYLAAHRTCVLSASTELGIFTMPVSYHSLGLDLECTLPSWADLLYYLEQEHPVELIICAMDTEGQSWLRYRGTAQVLTVDNTGALLSGFPAQQQNPRSVRVHIRPTRLDLIDPQQSWNSRETLEL